MITIDKAIGILSDSANTGITTFNQDFKDAQELGIEALKRVKDNPFIARHFFRALLPGETKSN